MVQIEGPRSGATGGRIVYRLDDLLAWSEQRQARRAKESGARLGVASAHCWLAGLGCAIAACPKGVTPLLL